MNTQIKSQLDHAYKYFAKESFIESDPIQIPHSFTRKEDIEISAFLTATIAWGNRRSIITNANRLMNIMDRSPFAFVKSAGKNDLKKLQGFVHRTFNGNDCTGFILSLRNLYKNHGGLEGSCNMHFAQTKNIRDTLIGFRSDFLDIPHPLHMEKHISDVSRGSAGKRLNLFLMWMVRRDKSGVHFGLWNSIPMSALMIPLDVHCGNVARSLGLLTRKQNDWKAVEELTSVLRTFNPRDPVKYDFALFCTGVNRCTGRFFP